MRDPLRVGILADTVDHPGGIGRYVREVLGAMARRDDLRLTVLAPTAATATVHSVVGDATIAMITPRRSSQIALAWWDRYRAGTASARANVEIIIGTKHLVPRTRRPTLLVVHDLLTITRADENALAKRVLLPPQYRQSLTAASALVAVSVATATRLAALDARWAAKCTVVPNGMSHRLIDAHPMRPLGTSADQANRLSDQPFALVVGDLSARKNLRLLTRLWREHPPPQLRLVVVGPDSGTDAPVRGELLDLERDGRAVWIRGAEDPELRWCYEHAQVVLFPTFEEGFGLPLLEARTFHAPVVASTDLALREVGGDDPHITYVDPTNTSGWRDAIDAAGRAEPRGSDPPALPPGAITWDEHTDRLVTVARALARGRSSPHTAA